MDIEINKDGNWKLYTNTLPVNSVAAGTVTRDGYYTGALVRIKATGLYVQVNAGAIRNLDQKKVMDAIGAGRPPKMTDGKRRNIYIDEASWQKAKELGNGKPSEGIRVALAHASRSER